MSLLGFCSHWDGDQFYANRAWTPGTLKYSSSHIGIFFLPNWWFDWISKSVCHSRFFSLWYDQVPIISTQPLDAWYLRYPQSSFPSIPSIKMIQSVTSWACSFSAVDRHLECSWRSKEGLSSYWPGLRSIINSCVIETGLCEWLRM